MLRDTVSGLAIDDFFFFCKERDRGTDDCAVQGLPLFQTVEHELGERTFMGRGVELI